MPRRLLFKEVDNLGETPPGYSSLGVDTSGKTITADEKGETKPLNDANAQTLMSDAQFYTAKNSFGGTNSIYVYEHWGVFSISDNNFHLCEMLYKLNTHDYFDANTMSKKIWGIFKENKNVLNFVDSFDALGELGLDLSNYLSTYRDITGLSVYQNGTGFTQSTYTPTGGSGTGLILQLRGSVLDIDFTDPVLSNNFPIEGYANQTVSFNQAYVQNGTGFTLDLTFDGSGNPLSYTITGTGSGYGIDDEITTNDPYAGSIKVKVIELGPIDGASIQNGGTGYYKGDILTVSGGDGNLQFEVIDLSDNTYDFQRLPVYSLIKVENGLKILQMAEESNAYIQYLVELDSDGKTTSFTLLNDRKISDGSYKLFENINPGYLLEEPIKQGNVLDGTFDDGTKMPFVRSEIWSNNFPRASFADLTLSFIQTNTTGSGSGFQVDITFDSNGNPTSNLITTAGASYSTDEILTLNTDPSNINYEILVKVDGQSSGEVTSINLNNLEYFNTKRDFCMYDFITDSTTLIIEDLESWWNTNADEPWIIDGQIPSFTGGIVKHPTSPLLIFGDRSGIMTADAFKESILVTPNKFHRFGDNKVQDYRQWMVTKDKIYLGNLLLG